MQYYMQDTWDNLVPNKQIEVKKILILFFFKKKRERKEKRKRKNVTLEYVHSILAQNGSISCLEFRWSFTPPPGVVGRCEHSYHYASYQLVLAQELIDISTRFARIIYVPELPHVLNTAHNSYALIQYIPPES